jgi:hypothetical protein
VTVIVGGTAGKSATWTIATPAGGGTFSPASGSVTIDSSNVASISTLYVAPTTGPGGSYTSQLILVRDSNFTAKADIPITLIPPTVAIASFVGTPAFMRNSASATVTVALFGSPGIPVTWTLAPGKGSFSPATGTVVLDGSGNAVVNSTYTLSSGVGGTTYIHTASAILGTGYAPPDRTASVTTATGVALFANTAYTDYIPTASGSEASNLEATLTGQGIAVSPFTGIAATDFATAIESKAVLAFPEMEIGSLGTALLADATATSAIVGWVQGGGVLFVSHPNSGIDDLNWLNSAFGFSLAGSGSGVITGNLLPSTGPFAAGPATIPYNNDTMALAFASLPGSAQVIYREATSLDAMVTVIPSGSGRIVILGWDWFDAAPTGLGDGGWLQVLQEAVAAAQAGTL